MGTQNVSEKRANERPSSPEKRIINKQSYAEKRRVRELAEAREEEEREQKLNELATRDRRRAEAAYEAGLVTLKHLEESIVAHIKEKTGHDHVGPETIEMEGYPEKYGFPSHSVIPTFRSFVNWARGMTDNPVDTELIKKMDAWKVLQKEVDTQKSKAAIEDVPLRSERYTERLIDRSLLSKIRQERLRGAYEEESKRADQRIDAENYRRENNLDERENVVGKEYSSAEDAERAFFDDETSLNDRLIEDRNDESSKINAENRLHASQAKEQTKPKRTDAELEEMNAEGLNSYLRKNMASEAELAAGRGRSLGLLTGDRRNNGNQPSSLERSVERAGSLRMNDRAEVKTPSETATDIMYPLYQKIRARQNQLHGETQPKILTLKPAESRMALKKEIDGLREELDLYSLNFKDSDAYKYLEEQIADLYTTYNRDRSAAVSEKKTTPLETAQIPETKLTQQESVADTMTEMEEDIGKLLAELIATADPSPQTLDRLSLEIEALEEQQGKNFSEISSPSNVERYNNINDKLSAGREKYLEIYGAQEVKKLPDQKSYLAQYASEVSRIKKTMPEQAIQMFDEITKHFNVLSPIEQSEIQIALQSQDVGTAYVFCTVAMKDVSDRLRKQDLSNPSPETSSLIQHREYLADTLHHVNKIIDLPEGLGDTLAWETFASPMNADNESIELSDDDLQEFLNESLPEDISLSPIDLNNRITLVPNGNKDNQTPIQEPRSKGKRKVVSLPPPSSYGVGSMVGPTALKSTRPMKRRNAA